MIPELFADFPGLFEFLKNQPDIFLVGGAIRDALRQRPVHDLDFVMSSDVRPLARRVADHFLGGFYMLDPLRNTARVILTKTVNGEKITFDFAHFQGETIEEDLCNRDFSVNAMAVSLASPQKLIDPCHGVMDLREKVLRTCLDHSISDDPVRILRAIRLSLELKMRLDSGTQKQMHRAVSSLTRISSERLRDELFRILEGKSPASAIRLLDHFGINAVLLPELPILKGVEQSPPHSLDVWEHTLATIKNLDLIFNMLVANDRTASDNLWAATMLLALGRYRSQLQEHYTRQLNLNRSRKSALFFTALYHDVGKPITMSLDEDGRIRFFEHEHKGAELTADRSRALALSQNEIDYSATIIENHLRPHFLLKANGSLTRRSIYRFFRDAGEMGIDICVLSLADYLATHNTDLDPDKWADRLETCQILFDSWWEKKAESITPPRLLTGDDLLAQFHLSPGPIIGYLLESLREAQAAGEITSREQALDFVRAKLKENPQ
jgi:tRNA nucleotidyltransferase/poly(A) polymerase